MTATSLITAQNQYDSSKLEPVGDRILIKPFVIEEKSAGGIVLASETVDKEAMAQIQAVVIKLGPEAYQGRTPWCKEGDKVLFAKYTGLLYKGEDGNDYRIVRDTDVIAVINY